MKEAAKKHGGRKGEETDKHAVEECLPHSVAVFPLGLLAQLVASVVCQQEFLKDTCDASHPVFQNPLFSQCKYERVERKIVLSCYDIEGDDLNPSGLDAHMENKIEIGKLRVQFEEQHNVLTEEVHDLKDLLGDIKGDFNKLLTSKEFHEYMEGGRKIGSTLTGEDITKIFDKRLEIFAKRRQELAANSNAAETGCGNDDDDDDEETDMEDWPVYHSPMQQLSPHVL